MDGNLRKILLYSTIALAFGIIVVLAIMLKQVFMGTDRPTNPAEQAYVVAKALVAQKPKDPDALFRLAKAEGDMGRTGDAIEHLKKAISIQPGAPMLHYTLAQVYQNTGKDDEAIKEYKEELRVTEERNELAWFELGAIFNKKKDYAQAAACLQKALTRMESGADAHYQLGKAYEGLGRDDLAVKEYEEVLKYIPDNADAQFAIQQLQLKKVRAGMPSTKK